ncbi:MULTISPECIES: YqcC family protein [unclassified Gilliamella]|uniref:YqcC family protein n=1 Tax=unclassified Gilliamella TaxID=2685620 RepID=UPI003A5CBDEB
MQANLIKDQLERIEQALKKIDLWQALPPSQDAFLSQQPFALDTMKSYEWLQWIFIPRIRAIIDANSAIPPFALHPYFEEALKESEKNTDHLLDLIKQLDELTQSK